MDRAPSYLANAKADLYLSELRPTKIRPEALVCINVFLDELLWLVLSSARSFNTDRLKSGLNKALPTSLGKEALLEAEVELRAYWEKAGPALHQAIDNAPAPSPSDFPLQAAFELLRHKCEAYSTLGELDEDPEVEAQLQARIMQASNSVPLNPSAVAPAALYLTAVLEHVCEHVLSNVARVTARDAARATASVSDLYVALCEDEAIYGLFRTMKVHEQIERQSKSHRPRRSKSISKALDHPRSLSRTSTASPQPPPSTGDTQSRSRASVESQAMNSVLSHPKQSVEKARAIKMFKNGQDANGHTPEHGRSASMMSNRKSESTGPLDDDDDSKSMQDFDELMRSGTTMKVSLTPDRLKTFEVYKQQKSAKNTPKGNQTSEPSKPLRTHASSKSLSSKGPIGSEPIDGSSTPPPPVPRQRNSSISGISGLGGFGRPKTPLGISNTSPPPPSSIFRRPSVTNSSTNSVPDSGMPKKNRPTGGRARNRESLDLDDIMGDEGDEAPPAGPSMLPKNPAPVKTSSSTRDLIDFLSEGPPDADGLPAPATYHQTAAAAERPPKTPGRFTRIVSRFGRSPSTEHLPSAPPSSAASAIAIANANGSPSGRTTGLSRSDSKLKKQKSIGSLSVGPAPSSPASSVPAIPNPPPVSYPKPPPMPRTSAPPSPASTTSPSVHESNGPSQPVSQTPSERTRQMSIHRKAVPQWEGSSTTPSPAAPPVPYIPPPSNDRKKTNGIHVPSSTPSTPKDATFHTPPQSAAKQQVSVPELPPTQITKPLPQQHQQPLAPTGLPQIRESDIQGMRRQLAKATSVIEARLLVDMHLAQWGLSTPVVDLSKNINEPSQAIPDTHGAGLIEVLLGDGHVEEYTDQDSQETAVNGHSSVPETVTTQQQQPNGVAHPTMNGHSKHHPNHHQQQHTPTSPTAAMVNGR